MAPLVHGRGVHNVAAPLQHLAVGQLRDAVGPARGRSGIVSQNRFVKAWINGNGATMQIRDHYNVSSLTDVGNSLFDVNFAVPLANANYAVTATMTQAADRSWGINIAANGINVAPMRMDANGIRLAAVDPHTFGAVFFGS
jgi:hypothetical protein